ncbi:MAG: tetratricopeptide repeat protein, partial [Muribaculaceae bacterium]|nr:tetratricopeptide repeat protein [Muribaculaceae bacterium]
MVALVACSTKKNTAGSRFWQAFTTRYNVYYNGETNYDEQIKVLENDYQDDYSQRLFIHPAEAYANPKATQPSGSFDRTIEKMQKAISLHSIKKKPQRKAGKGNDQKYKEWLKRDEYNPFIHNAWYLLAKSQYMKGDFLSSAATFHYITKHFTWMPDLVTESKLWEALNYCAMGWNTEADNILAHIHIDKIENNKLKSLANLAFADYYIKEKRTEQAIPYLAEAVKGAKGGQKVRLNFLLGQLYEEVGDKQNAYLAYKKAGSSNSSTYRTHFNARIKQSAVFQGENIKSEVRSLKAMTRYDRNKEYLDQIYYAIGNLYLSRKDTVNAVENYLLAAKKSTRNGIEKGISQLALGGIYFAQHKYDLAQPCYSEAIPLLKEDYPNYKELKQRSDVLDELAVYAQNVNLQDSLLRLSKMTLEEQKAVIKKIIDELKKKEKEEADEAARQEYMASQASKGSLLPNTKAASPTTFGINNDDSWYFYNTATKNAGKTAFQQQWGNRKLEDNWRRRNKQIFALDETSSDSDSISSQVIPGDSTALSSDTTAVDKKKLEREQDPHYEEYYLKQIPKTEEEIQTAHDVIQEGLYNMGVILKDKLEDYPAAEFEFNELLTRYPDNIYRLDAYYNMYLMYMRNEEIIKADRYRDLILSEFADSKYGKAMQDPNYLENLKNMETRQEQLYEEAYANYLNNNNEAVHAAYAEMMRTYPLSKIMPKFMFIDALAYVTQKDYDKFKSTLKEMLERYPETDITPTASSIVKQLNQGRKPNGGGSNLRGMIWSMRLSNDSTAGNIEKQLTPFTEGLDKPQVFVLAYSVDSVSPNQILYEVARHNFGTFKTQDYDLELMSFGSLGMLVVKGFANYAELLRYRTAFEQDDDMNIPSSAHQVLISEDNFNLLLSEGRSFEEYFNYLEGKNEKDVEAQVPDAEIDEEEEETDEAVTDKPRKSVKTSTSMPPKETDKKNDKADKKKEEGKKDAAKKDEGKKDEGKVTPKKEETPKIE